MKGVFQFQTYFFPLVSFGRIEANSPVAKFLSAAELEGISSTMEAEPGDLLLLTTDGLTIRGYLTLPPGRPGRGLPLVVLIAGSGSEEAPVRALASRPKRSAPSKG